MVDRHYLGELPCVESVIRPETLKQYMSMSEMYLQKWIRTQNSLNATMLLGWMKWLGL